MKPIFKIVSFTRHLWKWYLFMAIFVIVSSLLSLVVPVLSKQIVDIIVANINSQHVEITSFILLLIAIIATEIITTIFITFSQWIDDILTVKLQTFLSKKFYSHILNLNIGYYDNEITGKIVNKMYRGITSITDFMKNMFANFLPFFLTAIVTIILLAHYSLFIGIFLAILFPAYILISHKSTFAWEKYEDKKNKLNDISQGRVFENLSGIRVVKSFASELHELTSFLTTRDKIENYTIDQTKEWHWYDFLRRLCLNLILFAIFTYIVYWTFHGRFTLGEMTLLLQLVNQARFPLFAMSFILGQIQQASAGSADFFQVIETANQIKDSPYAKSLIVQRDTSANKYLIEFKKVFFEYDKDNNVLQNINFKILQKEKLALVGESGEGKSTIVNLLLRFYEPQKGEILINNQNIAQVSQKTLHENIAVVFQEALLFSGTIMENIQYGCPNATKDDIFNAAKAANAHEFIEKLSGKYNALIGERGVKLSGGQKQRIAIARAILKNAPIIILDEATSSLDSKSELEVQKGLDRLLKNRTSIIIAHRLSTIANADHILVISKGAIAQYGTSQELLDDKDGLYAELVKLQQQLIKTPSQEEQNKLQKFDIIG
ncbi:hypothetical protein A3D03_01440 [Candidatus Gottesmanbacteria bacterium RIFCSPHIGHO2_02_FULL_40_13]|uniref:Iron ABC transporter ATP-binding protein n=1 Tax=Candidatus Gottesmanbacteria bacterium RIFCSPHIGHO2_02_FULL_40_13 TaxID=1798384 RepID=A0A1F6ABK5_9BACT|nr:MAG: hypothetical protein A3D03_01440 [Candidatus Gottesmanbacteria bacterium RIFCSPHIGHO2_02_FULL_40_13]